MKTTKRKGMNNIVAKNSLVSMIEAVDQKIETNRLNNTPERRARFEQARAIEEYEKKLVEMRAQFKVGQLVWKKVVIDDGYLFGSGIILDRCERIVTIMPDSIETEMLHVTDGEGKKEESYENSYSFTISRGDLFTHDFDRLEKHTAKNGNTWWKVK
jgi:hypothetical protein